MGIIRFSFRIDGGRRLSPALPSYRWRRGAIDCSSHCSGLWKGVSVRVRCVEGLSGRLEAEINPLPVWPGVSLDNNGFAVFVHIFSFSLLRETTT